MAFGNTEKQKLYIVWMNMHKRCKDVNHPRHHRYGGRGISICQEWLDVNKFREWAINNGYKPGLTLDRTNNDGNYGPDNCRFVTYSVNNSNQSKRKPKGCIAKEGKKYYVRVTEKGKRKSIGSFTEIEQAKECLGKWLESL